MTFKQFILVLSLCVVSFSIGFLIGGLALVFPFIEKAFWEAKITDYFSLVLTVCVGGGAAYFISHSIEKNNHDVSVLDSLLGKIEFEYELLYTHTKYFIDKKNNTTDSPVQNDLTRINFSLKKISQMLSILEEIKRYPFPSQLRETFSSLKMNITDKNFNLIQLDPYNDEQINKIDNACIQFLMQLHRAKTISFS